MKKVLSMVLCVLMITVCFTACSKEKDFIGLWECEKVEAEGKEYTDNLMGVPIAVAMQFDIKEDGKGKVNTIGGASTDAKWTIEDSTITIEIDGEKVKFELKDDKLVGSEGEGDGKATFTLKKVDKLTEYSSSASK